MKREALEGSGKKNDIRSCLMNEGQTNIIKREKPHLSSYVPSLLASIT